MGEIRLRPGARQNGRLLQRIPQRFFEVVVGHLQVVLLGDCRAVPGSSELNAGTGVAAKTGWEKTPKNKVTESKREPTLGGHGLAVELPATESVVVWSRTPLKKTAPEPWEGSGAVWPIGWYESAYRSTTAMTLARYSRSSTNFTSPLMTAVA